MINNKHYFNIFIYLFLIISKTLSHIEPRNNETVKSNIDTTYGSIEIEYVKKKKEDHFKLKLMVFLCSLGGMLVLVCFIHTLVCLRPKYIEKRKQKKKKKKLEKKNKEGSMTNISNSNLNSYGMDELKEAKLKEPAISQEDSIDYNYNSSSTDFIITVPDNDSKGRKKSNSSKKY